MEGKMSYTKVISALFLVSLIAYVSFLIVKLFISGTVELTPLTLALLSIYISVVPILVTFVIAMFSFHAAKSGWEYYSFLALPITLLGLVVSGVWYFV